MTVQEATFYMLNKLRTIYEEGEASQVNDWVMVNITGSKKVERMLYKTERLTDSEENKLHHYTERLMQHEPVQYVLNESWFCGLKFYVDQNVLIPRPETEELVEWVISTPIAIGGKFPADELKILDIGAGSGCIAISLKRRIRKAEVWACDVSPAALEVAQRNAAALGADVKLVQLDFLQKDAWTDLPSFDIIVSNPPYIPEKDKQQMQPNILNYEPATALFVPDNDPLVFYKAIAEFGKAHLHTGGYIYLEIHESLGEPVCALFQSAGYHTELKRDMQQKDRMLRAVLSR